MNEYETTVISFLEILGQAGGIFEILFLISSMVSRIFSKFLLQKEIKKAQNKEKLKEEWFTYPTQNPHEFRKNKRRNKIQSALLESMGKFRMSNSNTSSQKYSPVEDRSQIYKHDSSKVKLEEIQEIIEKNSKNSEVLDSLDIINISQSLYELKAYVSYLMTQEKDSLNSQASEQQEENPSENTIQHDNCQIEELKESKFQR